MDSYNFEELLLYRSLIHLGINHKKESPRIIYSPSDILERVEYGINSYGYRSDEFDKDNEVLVLGCSQTYGAGMPNEFTWSEIFCKSINKKCSRLAFLGDSIGGQIYKAFRYFEEIGNPKIIVALFPINRLEYPIIPESFLSTGGTNLENRPKTKGFSNAYFNERSVLKFSKVPHDPTYVIPNEFVVFYNFMFISMLEQYCKSNHIKLIWSIYDDYNLKVDIESLPNISNNYLKTSKYSAYDDFPYKTIHDECVNKINNNHKLYDWAADYGSKRGVGHWGIHNHQHMAELFINRYMEIDNDK
jgi:hypothetical protein